LGLRGLGLTDSHVLAIVDRLSTPGIHLGSLNLDSNPGITAQGYGALLNLINRANVISYYELPSGKSCVCLDDKAWEGKLNLVREMNWVYKRTEFLTNGSFSSEERRWQWLEWVVGLPTFYDEDEEDRGYDEEDSSYDEGRAIEDEAVWDRKIDNATRINFIWYILRENPEMMRTSNDMFQIL
jgi:hypothetical protein